MNSIWPSLLQGHNAPFLGKHTHPSTILAKNTYESNTHLHKEKETNIYNII
jgi:hypothetical protein